MATTAMKWKGAMMPDGVTPQRFFRGIPARDLTAAEVAEIDDETVRAMLASGLYEGSAASRPAPASTTEE